jgi:hypothetical protein
MNWGNTNRVKVVTTFFLAAWPNLAGSAIFTASNLGWQLVVLCLGGAIYQGVFAINRLLSNPNKQEPGK